MVEEHKLVEKHVGIKIQQRRKKLHLSQAELGKILGISAQQIQRYESGENSVPLAKLMHIGNALNIKPHYFLEDLDIEETGSSSAGHASDTISRGLGRDLHVLLVEDDVNDAHLFIAAAEKTAVNCNVYHLLQADKVQELLDHHKNRFNTEYPDVIILDINMPRVNGITVLKNIKESSHKKIPVIMLTNSIRAKDMLECYELGASGFIQKSVDLYQYNDDVDRILSYWSQLAILPSAA